MSHNIEELFSTLIVHHEYAFEEYEESFSDNIIEKQYLNLEDSLINNEFLTVCVLDIGDTYVNVHQRVIRTRSVDQFYWQELGEKNNCHYSCLALILNSGETLFTSLDQSSTEEEKIGQDYKKAGKVLYLTKKED